MNYSQKIARAFEIVDYILLIPAGFGVFAASLLIKDALWFTLLIYAVFIFGFVLLVGYFKHSRGRLDENRVRSLWIASAVYNGILLLPTLAIMFFFLKESNFEYKPISETAAPLAINFGTVFAYLAAIFSSIKAYRFDNNQKYL